MTVDPGPVGGTTPGETRNTLQISVGLPEVTGPRGGGVVGPLLVVTEDCHGLRPRVLVEVNSTTGPL